MKKNESKLAQFSKQLEELTNGQLDGGFAVILSPTFNSIIIGGNEGDNTNNCNGGNCIVGCGTNTAAGCGGTVNSVAGCGVKKD
ncbi:hypothetical protein [Pedobacter rhodius]|uniref:Natural product n=1 Tax=Pedobacter rhodius TaxID=3004098 RepID=A0ABT4KYL2_9SPHI|nr:hypothetical protein [Pedobacter sp. SJ11]MCZ4223999.1 hypothetical protein [Pedobacter sp. SJ11]